MDEGTEKPTHSPVIKKPVAVLLTFPEAMEAVIAGKKVTRKAWRNPDFYGIMKDGFLELHKDDGKFYTWTVNDGDLLADDWVTIGETN